MSSLLMQAARSAAIEDGVAIPEDAAVPSPFTTNHAETGHRHGQEMSLGRTAVQEEQAMKANNAQKANKGNHGTDGQQINMGGSTLNDGIVSVAAATAVATAAVTAPLTVAVTAAPSSFSVTSSSNTVTNAVSNHSNTIQDKTKGNNNDNNKNHHPSSAGSAAHLASSQKAADSRSLLTNSTNSHAAITVPGLGPTSASSPSSLPPAAAPTASNRTTGNNADVANSNGTATSGGGKKKGPPLRRGKWSAEEEAYANRLIMEFKAGLLPLTDGTTLRTFLSKLLNCDPMRISKKFVGNNCIGKQVFRRRTADINRLTPEQIQQSRLELSE